MPTIKLFADLSDLIVSQSQDVVLGDETSVLSYYGLNRYTFGGLRAYVFDSHLTDGAPFALTPMYIPAYFDQIPAGDDGIKRPIQGMFALRLGQDETEGKGFIGDKGHGRFGCPTRILLNTTGLDYFTFNNMRFYPFLMTDLSIGYYVCDNREDERIIWPAYNATTEKGVSLDFPLSYDPTLGLYITRAASVVNTASVAATSSMTTTPISAPGPCVNMATDEIAA